MVPMADNVGPTDGKPAPTHASSKRMQQTQAQVNEVVDIMRVNMEKVLERDAKLAQLDDRADALQAGASQFEASAGKLKNKYWWKNMKMTLVLGGVGLVLLVILCWYIFGGKKAEEPPSETPTSLPPAPTPAHVLPAPHAEVPSTVEQNPKLPTRIRRSPTPLSIMHSASDKFPTVRV